MSTGSITAILVRVNYLSLLARKKNSRKENNAFITRAPSNSGQLQKLLAGISLSSILTGHHWDASGRNSVLVAFGHGVLILMPWRLSLDSSSGCRLASN